MRAILLLSMRNIRSNLVKHLSMGVLYMLVCVTAVAGVAFTGTASRSRLALLRDETLNTQIRVISRSRTNGLFRDAGLVKRLSEVDGASTVIPYLYGAATLADGSKVILTGSDLAALQKVHPFSFVGPSKADLERRDAIIISDRFAGKHGLKVGDTVRLAGTSGSADSFHVAGIARVTGRMEASREVFVSLGSARAILGLPDGVSELGITVEDMGDAEGVCTRVSGLLPGALSASTTYALGNFTRAVSSISLILGIMVFFGIAISLVLSFSVFRTLICTRLRQVGVVRCIGLLRRDVYISYLLEYGLIALPASLLGLVLSFPAVAALTGMVGGDPAAVTPGDVASPWLLVLAFIIVNPLPMLLVIRARSSGGIVGLMKGADSVRLTRPRRAALIALAVSALAGAAGFLIATSMRGPVALGASFLLKAVSLLAAFQLVVWLLIWLFDAAFARLTRRRSVAGRYLLAGNWRFEYAAALVAVGIGVGLFCLALGDVIGATIQGVYTHSDIWVSVANMEDDIRVQQLISKHEHVTRAVRSDTASVRIKGRDLTLSGIDPDAYGEISFETFDAKTKDKGFDLLKEADSIILSDTFAEANGLATGDRVTITGGRRPVKLTVVATVGTFENMGKMAFVSSGLFREHFAVSYVTYLLNIDHSREIDRVKDELAEELDPVANYSIQTIAEMQEQSRGSNELTFKIVYAIDALISAVIVVGLVNNTIVDILGRRREFAVRRTIGQPLRSIMGTLFFQGALLGVVCGIFGTVLSWLVLEFAIEIARPYIGSIATPRPALTLWPVLATAAIFEVSYLLCWRRLRKLDNTAVARGGE